MPIWYCLVCFLFGRGFPEQLLSKNPDRVYSSRWRGSLRANKCRGLTEPCRVESDASLDTCHAEHRLLHQGHAGACVCCFHRRMV